MEKEKIELIEIYQTFKNLIYKEVRKHLSQSELIEECIQEILLYVFKKYELIASMDDDAQAVYIGKICRGTAINYYNREIRKHNQVIDVKDFDAFLEVNYIVTDVIIDSQMDVHISKLSAMEREIIYLIYYDEFSYKDAAAILMISEENARQRLCRARKHLKEIMSEKEF